MIDIDADPIIYNQLIYAATYQGKIAALDGRSGRKRWTHDISSYTGMAADQNAVYVSDAKGHIWSFDAYNGQIHWEQNALDARNITAPVVMGHYIVVGDQSGYLHWVNTANGQLAARESVGSSISAKPLIKNGILYALTQDGNLSALTIRS